MFNVRGGGGCGGYKRTTWQAGICLVHFSLTPDNEGFVSRVRDWKKGLRETTPKGLPVNVPAFARIRVLRGKSPMPGNLSRKSVPGSQSHVIPGKPGWGGGEGLLG